MSKRTLFLIAVSVAWLSSCCLIGCGAKRSAIVVGNAIEEVTKPVVVKQCFDNSVILKDGGQCEHTLQFTRLYQSCLLSDEGKQVCWGGDVSTKKTSLSELKGKIILTKEGCLLTDANEVTCAGLPSPIDFGPDFEVKDLAIGSSVYCALSKKGLVKCVGANDVGQLASGDTTSRLALSNIPTIDFGHNSPVSKIWYGRKFGIAQFEDGKIKGWGENVFQTLVNSDETYGTADDAIGDTSDEIGAGMPFIDFGDKDGASLVLKNVALIRSAACFLFERGLIKCHGGNRYGALGANVRNIFNGEVDLGTGFVADKIFGGYSHLCALTTEGQAKCWGKNHKGQLGLGDIDHRGESSGDMGDDLPLLNLGTDLTIKHLSLGVDHTCAVLSNHKLKCWGNNEKGQLKQVDETLILGDDEELGDALPFLKF